MAGISTVKGRQTAINSPEYQLQYGSPPPQVDLRSPDLRSPSNAHGSSNSRDPSLARGRINANLNTSSPGLQSQAPFVGRAISPRILAGNGDVTIQTETTVTTSLERQPSISYGHHRQASIVHGVPQHSRNSSFAASPAMSHRSPQAVALHNGYILEASNVDALSSEPPDYTTSMFSPDLSSNSGHNYTPTSSHAEDRDILDNDLTLLTQRRVERQPSGKARREHSRSQPKPQAEQSSVGEYALHHLFNSFVGQADNKINQCVDKIPDSEPRVEEVCGPGVDPAFDQLISALGHIARQKPKPLVDTIMFWRQTKGEAANKAQQEMNQARGLVHRPLPRRNTEPVHTLQQELGHSHSGSEDTQNQPLASYYNRWKKANQQLNISNYLLCRVLIEVYHQSDIKSILPLKLEDRIFEQLTRLDYDRVVGSNSLFSNWKIYGQLLGVMSISSFRLISQRYLNALQAIQEETGSKNTVSKEVEGRIALLVVPMKYLCIRTQPESSWRESCEFLHALGKLLINSHGQAIKEQYLKALEALVFPVAASASAQIATPKWKEFLNMLNARLTSMLVKPRYWLDAFPLSTLMLCASPVEVFAGQWLSIISTLQAKLKERANKGCVLQAICWLVWTYLHRTSEAIPIIMRKLEDVVKIVLPTGKKTYISTDPMVVDPIVQLIRIIGSRFPEFCFKMIIFPLINSEIFATSRDVKAEHLEPERVVIGIKGFLTVIASLENPESGDPRFPRFNVESGVASTSPNAPNYLHHAAEAHTSSSTPEDTALRPVVLTKLDDTCREYYVRFCEILGKITLICDYTFGGQAVLDEKFGGQPPPKTPIAESFTFSRKDEQYAGTDAKQAFYELLHVAVQALPRCLSSHIPFNPLINLLCTGTAHVQNYIAVSSARSLKAIAREAHAQPVTIGFARFIFNFDIRYSTMSDEGMLGPGHIENTLKLYLELLQIWIEEIREKTKSAGIDSPQENYSMARSLQLDLTNISALVEEVESHGVFFLCSQSRKVRAFAVSVLRLVTEFDTALGRSNPRIIQILDGDLGRVINVDDDRLTVAERSRLQKEQRKSSPQNTLIELCSSVGSYDSTLWFKIYPNLIRLSLEMCPNAIILGREIVCHRLYQMQSIVSSFVEAAKNPHTSQLQRDMSRVGATSPEIIVEQWKLYLIMACTTLTNAGAQTQNQLATQHMRSKSKPPQQGQEKLTSARSLFSNIIPLLGAGPSSIRDAIVTALGSVNIKLYRTLLESLQYAVTTCNEEARNRLGSHQRSDSSPQKNRRTDRLRTEVTHVYKLTSRYLHEEAVLRDDWIISNLINYTDGMRIFLSDTTVQNDWEFQTLRRHYCGLMEEVFEGINRLKEPSRWMSFQARIAAFGLMEDWCGYSPNQSEVTLREDSMKQSALNQHRDTGTRTNATAAIEVEKRDLRTAALSAMASLCAGPISVVTDRGQGTTESFDVYRMLSWIDSIFGSPGDKTHLIGRKALKNLITHNKTYPTLLEHAIEKCYSTDKPKALESYFEVVNQVLNEHDDYPLAFWRILGALLFTLGSEKRQIRTKSARLLRTLELRQQKNSKLQDFDISISDKTTAVYKLAQFEISKRLTIQHSELAFFVFSQFAQHYKNIHPDAQRNMIAAILPWIQIIELELSTNGRPTPPTYMLLANLLEITTKSSTALHNEVQALWQALATGPHGGNVQLILDFVISLCIDRREQSFVDYAKQIVVFLSSTPAGEKVIEFLLLQITPRNMVYTERPNPMEISPDISGLPYIADLGEALPIGNKQSGFSLGQLSLILLVDLLVAPVKLARESVPLLLQVCIILWDHYTAIVQEQAREMLVHLIHELVISRIGDDTRNPSKAQIEDFVEAIRQSKPQVVWNYHEGSAMDLEAEGNRVPAAMDYLTQEVISIFSLSYPEIHEQWAKATLTWATACSVRHLACRSFQVFRCILSKLDKTTLVDMLARLSNTIADESPEVQTFSMEILTTLKTVIAAIPPADQLKYPQLFWAICACLSTVNECEFMETLAMLETLLAKVDLSDPAVIKILSKAKPERWEGPFDGIMSLIYKGLKSELSLKRTLAIVLKASPLPDSDLVGDHSRILYSVLGYLPCFLHCFDAISIVDGASALEAANVLASVAEAENYPEIATVLTTFASKRYGSAEEFLEQILPTVRQSFFPKMEFNSLVFLMGLLANRLRWYKLKTMQILCAILPDINMQHPDFASHGPDLISPLLRLLQTEYCPQALEVMDHVLTVAATPMDKHHLRMSMASHGSRTIRKEYERTKSLYGIPEETGWSIPAPAIMANTTRVNVHAVFYTFADATRAEVEPTTTPEVAFDAEEYQNSSYYPTDGSFGTLANDDAGIEHTLENNMHGPLDDLVSKLDSLDDFFADACTTDDKYRSGYSDVTIKGYSSGLDGTADLYDQQTAPILQRSLASDEPNSLHNSFADMRASPREAELPPVPFDAKPPPPPPPSSRLRPRLHSRSITSPSNSFLRGQLDGSTDDEPDEIFSDDERSSGNSGPPMVDMMMRRSKTTTRKTMASTLGRPYRQGDLLKGQARSRSKSQAPDNPEVPKVPIEYLNAQLGKLPEPQ